MTCPSEDCSSIIIARELCRRHYRPSKTRICQVDECSCTNLARGYCSKHYYQISRHGQIMDGRWPKRKLSDEVKEKMTKVLIDYHIAHSNLRRDTAINTLKSNSNF